MATNDQVFTPTTAATAGLTVKITATQAAGGVAGTIAATSTGNTIRVMNNGTVAVFVRMTNEATPAATAADVPIAAGASEVFASPGGSGVAVGLAALSSTNSSNDVYFTPGYGA